VTCGLTIICSKPDNLGPRQIWTQARISALKIGADRVVHAGVLVDQVGVSLFGRPGHQEPNGAGHGENADAGRDTERGAPPHRIERLFFWRWPPARVGCSAWLAAGLALADDTELPGQPGRPKIQVGLQDALDQPATPFRIIFHLFVIACTYCLAVRNHFRPLFLVDKVSELFSGCVAIGYIFPRADKVLCCRKPKRTHPFPVQFVDHVVFIPTFYFVYVCSFGNTTKHVLGLAPATWECVETCRPHHDNALVLRIETIGLCIVTDDPKVYPLRLRFLLDERSCLGPGFWI